MDEQYDPFAPSTADQLEQALDSAAARLLAERPSIHTDDLGQRWLIPLDIVQACHTYDRAVSEAEACGTDAGWCWALEQASIQDLEKINASSVDMSVNEISTDDMLSSMHARNVPAAFAPSFLRGFVQGVLTAWECVKPRILDAISND